MSKVQKFMVKVIIDRAEHQMKKKIIDALGKSVDAIRSKDITLVEVKETK